MPLPDPSGADEARQERQPHQVPPSAKVIGMRDRHAVRGKRAKWLGMMGMLAALLLVSAVPGYARVRVFIGPGVVVPFGPFWAPYWAPYGYPYGYPYAYPSVVTAPPPQVYGPPSPPVAAQPPPPSYWYHCDSPAGYYPYVQQCSGGWKQVPMRPQ
jgi:hypothetical protein